MVNEATAPSAEAAAAAVMLTSGASGRINALFSPRLLRSLLTVVINALLLVLLFPFRRRGGGGGGGVGKASTSMAAASEKEKEKVRDERVVRGGGAVVRVPASVPWKSSTAAVAAVDQDVAARRAIAIRRVMQGSDGDCIRDFSLFVTPRGDTMFTQFWKPVSTKIRGLVIILHGLNEHGDRYNGFAKELNTNGYKVYAMDWIGHGGSDGLHGYVHSLDDAILDMKSFILKVIAENPGLPCFCFGHSTGAAIILKAVLDPKIEAIVAGVVLTSPAVGVQPSHSVLAMLAPVFSFLLPRYQLTAANKQGILVSRDPDALVAKYSDPLVYTGSIRIRTGYELLRITHFLQQNLSRLEVAFLVLHGTADSITDPKASRRLYEEAASTDKTIRLLPGLLHDLLFEPEREMIVQEIINWFNCRINM